MSRPYTLDRIETLSQSIEKLYDTVSDSIIRDAQLSTLRVTLPDLILSNGPLVSRPTIDPSRSYRYPMDQLLTENFPTIGQGTQSLVFDIGTCVLKRVEDQANRGWEFDCERQAVVRGFKARTAVFYADLGNYQADIYFVAQEKLTPIDVTQYLSKIRELYYPEIAEVDFSKPNEWGVPGFMRWEWGLTPDGIPKVFDWG